MSTPAQVAEPPAIPHLEYPFTFVTVNGQKRAVVVEQDSLEEITACVAAILACPVGTRIDLPAFGVPSPLFAQAPVDSGALQFAIARWEPRAATVAREFADPASAGTRHLELDVTPVQQDS